MAKDSDNLAKRFDADNTGGVLSGLLAEEDEFDRRALWRLGSWAAASVGAVVLAMLASQSSTGIRRDQMASADLVRQSQQVEQLARDAQKEAGRLASAVDILNSDRDRLYSRVAVLEQGLDSVTGTIARRQSVQPAPAQTGSLGNSPTASPPNASSSAAASPSVVSPSIAPPNITSQSATPATIASQGAASSGTASPNTGSSNVAPPSPAPPSPALTSPAPPSTPSPNVASPGPAPTASPAPATVSATSISTTPSAEASATVQKPAPVASTVVAATAATVEKPPIVALGGDPGPATASSAAASMPAAQGAIPAATSLVTPKSMMGPPDPAASKLIEPGPAVKGIVAAPLPELVASTQPAEDAAEDEASATKSAVQRTEFGVDVGGANSIPGLRALWRGLLKSKSNAPLATLRPIIVIREGHNGLGMQLRLVAGPISDAATAAKICAAMMANDRSCATAVFEGQRLAMNADEPTPAPESKPAPEAEAKPAAGLKPSPHKHYATKRSPKEESAQKPEPSGLSSIFGRTSR